MTYNNTLLRSYDQEVTNNLPDVVYPDGQYYVTGKTPGTDSRLIEIKAGTVHVGRKQFTQRMFFAFNSVLESVGIAA